MKKLLLFVILVIIGFVIYIIFNFGPGLKPIILPPPDTEKPDQISSNLLLPSFPLSLDPNIKVGIFTQDLDGPRVLTFDENDVLIASLTKKGQVVALPDNDNNNQADKTVILASGLNRPHGLAFWQEPNCSQCPLYLYVAQTDELGRYIYNSESLILSQYEKIMELPGGGNHFTRTIDFGPDEKLYISIGSTCNVCFEEDERRATILQANPDGSNSKIYARGLRNAVFFVWHPALEPRNGSGPDPKGLGETQKLWVTEMGRDLLGDNIPPDEINIVEENGNYGWPLCYGKNTLDTNFHKDDHVHIRSDCTEPFEKLSLIDMQAHVAPLGLNFIPDDWPEDLAGDLLVAWHGSWNRSTPVGYKVVRYEMENNLNKDETAIDFISGWLVDNRAISRPADLKFDSKGRLFISDDKGGMIYVVMPK